LKEWQNSLNVIRVASEEQLAVVEEATLLFKFYALQPDAQFLFRKTFNLQLANYYPESTSTGENCYNTAHDKFTISHNMPNLQILKIECLDKNMEMSLFSPQFSNLRELYLGLSDLNQVNRGQLCYLVNLKSLSLNYDSLVSQSSFFVQNSLIIVNFNFNVNF
jgi:hypothetical protein